MSLRPFLLLAFLTLSACVTYPDISQSRSPCRAEPGGWCGFVREGALEAYPYAIAALQAYEGDDDLYDYPIPMLERLERLPISEGAAEKGFDYQIFAQYERGSSSRENRQPIARVLAFRGTDFDGFTDVFYGTLRNDQIDFAIATYEAEAARFEDDIPWVVTGHSLGGALATEVSIKYPHVRAFMFNTSPFYGGDAMTNDNQRVVFNERGEVLRRFARYDEAPAADLFTLNCNPGKGTFYKHKLRPLADCLVWISAYADEDAFAIVAANDIAKPTVECGPANKPHPGVGFRQIAPCAHQARPSRQEDEDELQTAGN